MSANTDAKKSAELKDLEPKQDPKGGIGMLLPAVQRIREAALSELPTTPMADNFQGGCLK
jgi:hypothetical protein